MTRIELEDTFGDILRKAMAGTKTSLEMLASKTGLSTSTLSEFLADQAQPSEPQAKAVAGVLGLDPHKYADSGLRRWYPDEQPMPGFLVHQINAPHPSNGYFLLLRDRNIGAFVDPAGRPEPIVDEFRRAGIDLRYILLTHKHADHSDALAAVRRAFPHATPVMHPSDAAALAGIAKGATEVVDGARLPFGKGEIEMLHTPGHTDGSSCFLYKGNAFTGDTLFAGSLGRLLGDRFGYEDLLRSVREKLFSLPETTVVFPGHGPSSTIGQERAHNPFFLS